MLRTVKMYGQCHAAHTQCHSAHTHSVSCPHTVSRCTHTQSHAAHTHTVSCCTHLVSRCTHSIVLQHSALNKNHCYSRMKVQPPFSMAILIFYYYCSFLRIDSYTKRSSHLVKKESTI